MLRCNIICRRAAAFVIILGAVVANSTFGQATRPTTQPSSEARVVGGGTIPAPADGFLWQKVDETKDADSETVEIFLATKEGSTAKVVLIAEQATADTDAEKLARIKADYNGMVTSLREQGYTNLKGTKPPMEAPLPDRVEFSLAGTNAAGEDMAFEGVLYFGTSTYHFQVAAETPDEAKSLAEVAQRIQE